ncbi:MAG: deoxyribose-phosphate aldolase [Deltaproteobacteria bacterium]|nr:deoxyribose-phosphate aldolase [Deltaproteobacteria bacterium]MBN2671432.1 deoxyribose-phosphate aldolase [Deltaproteobacteria bacterium]
MSQIMPPLPADEIHAIFQQTRNELSSSANNTAEIPTILAKPEKRIEHTLLKVDATDDMIDRLCAVARAHAFRAVCCLPRHIEQCRAQLAETEIKIVSVVDFPLCGSPPDDVAYLASSAIQLGADEIDMVLDVNALKSRNLSAALHRIMLVTELSTHVPVKVILETACLTEEEIIIACAVCQAAGAAFVKTSTGFTARGASVRDIEVMKSAVGDTMRIKASGGIKTADFAAALIAAGADVIGTSNGPACM